MIDVVFSAFAKAAPDRVVANAYGTINALSIAGKRSNGQPWVMFSFYGGGHGGSGHSGHGIAQVTGVHRSRGNYGSSSRSSNRDDDRGRDSKRSKFAPY